jgi:hypothetical protein
MVGWFFSKLVFLLTLVILTVYHVTSVLFIFIIHVTVVLAIPIILPIHMVKIFLDKD